MCQIVLKKHRITVTGVMLFFVLGFLFVPAIAQMPDWIMINDRDGNRYFLDTLGKIHTSGKPEFNYKPVSKTGIGYYYNHAIELLDGHYKVEGLTLLKSILTLPPADGRIVEMQKKAAKKLNDLIKKEGSRFEKYNFDASLILYRSQEMVYLYNDRMRYHVGIPGEIQVIRKRIRRSESYLYYGVLIGVELIGKEKQNRIGKNHSEGFDFLLAIDSEEFPYRIHSINQLEENWRKNLGSDTFRRTLVEKSSKRIIYYFTDKIPPYYSGYESFYYMGRIGYCMRTISTKASFDLNKGHLLSAIKNIGK